MGIVSDLTSKMPVWQNTRVYFYRTSALAPALASPVANFHHTINMHKQKIFTQDLNP